MEYLNLKPNTSTNPALKKNNQSNHISITTYIGNCYKTFNKTQHQFFI